MPVTLSNLQRVSEGNKWKILGQLTWTTYTAGGDVVKAAALGLSRIESFKIDSEGGFAIEGEINAAQTQVNVFAYRSAGFIPEGTISAPNLKTMIEETVAVAANSGTLANLPAIVQNVFVTAGAGLGAKTIIPSGQAPTAGQVSINMMNGNLIFNAADAVTSAQVTYVRIPTTVPTLAGSAIAAAELVQVSNGTDLSMIGAVEFEAVGL